MTVDSENKKHILADEGKIFRRKDYGDIMGKEIYLGYSYYLGGQKLVERHLDKASDFEEIDDESEITNVELSNEIGDGEGL